MFAVVEDQVPLRCLAVFVCRAEARAADTVTHQFPQRRADLRDAHHVEADVLVVRDVARVVERAMELPPGEQQRRRVTAQLQQPVLRARHVRLKSRFCSGERFRELEDTR